MLPVTPLNTALATCKTPPLRGVSKPTDYDRFARYLRGTEINLDDSGWRNIDRNHSDSSEILSRPRDLIMLNFLIKFKPPHDRSELKHSYVVNGKLSNGIHGTICPSCTTGITRERYSTRTSTLRYYQVCKLIQTYEH